MKKQFKNGEIVTVGKLNTHGFKLGEKIQVIKLDKTARISDTVPGTPVYWAKSKSKPKNKWWIAETEIAEAIPEPKQPTVQDTQKEMHNFIKKVSDYLKYASTVYKSPEAAEFHKEAESILERITPKQ